MLRIVWSNPNKQVEPIPTHSIRRLFTIEDERCYGVSRKGEDDRMFDLDINLQHPSRLSNCG